jgi:RHS repeat-associated protein
VWYLTDKLGSVREDVNSSGTVLDSITYDTYGNILAETASSSGDRFKFTSREWDSEIGQNFYRMRYYNPVDGRFESEDELGFQSGDTNLFRYVRNLPNDATDPSGQVSVKIRVEFNSSKPKRGATIILSQFPAKDGAISAVTLQAGANSDYFGNNYDRPNNRYAGSMTVYAMGLPKFHDYIFTLAIIDSILLAPVGDETNGYAFARFTSADTNKVLMLDEARLTATGRSKGLPVGSAAGEIVKVLAEGKPGTKGVPLINFEPYVSINGGKGGQGTVVGEIWVLSVKPVFAGDPPVTLE